jgi:hypothetical protein
MRFALILCNGLFFNVSVTQYQAYLGLLLEKLDDPRFNSAIQDSRIYWEKFLHISTKYIVFILADPSGSAV